MRTLTLKVFRDTVAHVGQFVSLIVLVALGIMSYVTFQNGYYDLRASLDRAYETLGFARVTVAVERAPFTAAGQVEGLPGVVSARVRTVQDVGLERDDGSRAIARIISVPEHNATDVNRLHLERGRFPSGPHEAVVNTQFSTDTGTDPGDTLTLRIAGERRVLRVVGVGTDPEYLYALRGEGDLPSPGAFAVVFVTEHAVEELLGRRGWGNDVAVRIAPEADSQKIAELVEDELEPYGVRATKPESEQAGWVGLDSEVEQNRVMARTLPVLVLAVSMMSLFIALSRMVQAQRGQIGLAKALGYSDAQVLGHYLSFAVVVATLGSVLGLAGGMMGARGTAGLYVSMLGLPFLESAFYPRVAAVAVGLAFVACLLAAAAPAWRSARIAPAVAMHADPNVSLTGGGIPLLERFAAALLPRSFTVRIPLRNLFRSRRRSLYTVLGIAFAMVLSVTTIAMFDSIDYLMNEAFVEVERWDIVAVLEAPVGSEWTAAIEALDGVKRVQPAFALPVTVAANGREEDVALTAMNPSATFHGFASPAGAAPRQTLEAGGLVLARATADRLGIAPGAPVTLDSPLFDEPVTVEVGSLSGEILGQPGFISLDELARIMRRPAQTYNMMYLTANEASAEKIEDELYDMSGVASVEIKAGLFARIKKMMEMFSAFGTVLLAFGGALAFVVVFTTFTANVTERTREIATMRTIGEDNGRLALMILLESLALTVAALPLGVWLGLQAIDLIFSAFDTESYTITAYIYPLSVLRISLLMLGVVVLSQIGPVRRIFRLDLAEATKVME